MNSISKLSDQELLNKIKSLVSEEKRVTQEVLDHLEEIEYRKLYLEKGYSSLFTYCVEELKYSESSAHRRISSMRVIRKIPQAKESLEKGTVNLSTLTQLHGFLRKEEKVKTYTKEMKVEILEKISGKSQKECEMELIKLSPQDIQFVEREKVLTENLTQMTFVANRELKSKFDMIRNLTAHKISNPTLADLLNIMADIVIAKLNLIKTAKEKPDVIASADGSPRQKDSFSFIDTERIIPENFASAAEVNARKSRHDEWIIDSSTAAKKIAFEKINGNSSHSRYIPANIRKYIWKRDQSCCQYTDKSTNKKCESKFALQIDHVHPFSLGGVNHEENLRLLCRAHNSWRTKELYKN